MAAAQPWTLQGGKELKGHTLGSRFPTQNAAGPDTGVLFRLTKKGLYFCGAGVTSSPNRNLLATAADCLTSDPADKLAFAPQVFKNATGALEAPKGVYTVKRQGNRSLVWTGSESGGAAPSAAVGFAMVDKGINGDQLEDTVPGHRLLTDAGHTHKGVRVAGHGASETRPGDPCTGDTSKAKTGAPNPYLRLDCGPAGAGIAAGSVFIADYDAKTRVGNLIGVSQRIAAPENPFAIHSAYFDNTVQALYDEAVSGSKPTVTPPITPPGVSPSQPAPVPSLPPLPVPPLRPPSHQIRQPLKTTASRRRPPRSRPRRRPRRTGHLNASPKPLPRAPNSPPQESRVKTPSPRPHLPTSTTTASRRWACSSSMRTTTRSQTRADATSSARRVPWPRLPSRSCSPQPTA